MISSDKQYEADTNLYNPSEIEKNGSQYGQKTIYTKPRNYQRKAINFMPYQCFPTLQVIFIWDMLGIMLLQT